MRVELRERLRRLGVRKGTSHLCPRPTPPDPPATTAALEGQEVVTARGTFHLRAQRFPLDAQHGHYPLGRVLSAPLEPLPDLLIPTGSPVVSPIRMAFLDTETTGLAGGTGTVAFLVGVGFIGEEGVEVRQYFLRDLDEEPAMLEHLADDLTRRNVQAVVTYNGRGFDLPLLETRFTLNAIPSPMGGLGHLDLLIHARRLWRPRLRRCSLGNVEAHVLGHRRDGIDIPGWLVPYMYREYLHTRDPRPLRQIFYHNLHDILSLIVLTDIVLRAWHDPWSEPTLAPEDFLARARAFLAAGEWDKAESALRHILHHAARSDVRQRAYALLGTLLKRRERWDDAVRVWERWLEEYPQALEPHEELAKYYEWQVRDPAQALVWTERALGVLAQGGNALSHRWRDAFQHRRERLLRKCSFDRKP